MKKNKLFLIPLLSITATTLSVVPAFTSCSCDNDKPISEDYSLSVVTDKTETDIYYNGNIDKYLTDNKQYVTFELKLNQPFYIEWKDEVVSQIVGLPWIDSSKTEIKLGSTDYKDIINVDKTEIQLYPSADNQTFTLFVPYTIDDSKCTPETFKEGKNLFSVKFTAKFYKGTGAQFENDEMTPISEPFSSTELTVVQKNEIFVKADKTAKINVIQSDEPIKFTYDLHKDGYTLMNQSSTYGLEYELPYDRSLFVPKTDGEYEPKISGNQLTFYISPSENLRRFKCMDRTGDLEETLSSLEFKIKYTPGNITPRAWEFKQAWTLNYQETTNFVEFESGQEKTTQLSRKSSESTYSQQVEFKFKLKTPLKENQQIHIYGMTTKGPSPYEGQPIQFDAGWPLYNGLVFDKEDIGEDNEFIIPQIANCTYVEQGKDEQTLDIQYSIECVDWNEKGKTIWTQTFNGFEATVYRDPQ